MIITVLEALKLIILLLIIIYAILATCGAARHCSYNRVVHTLDHMRNRTEVSPCTKTRSQKKLCRNV